MITRSEICDKMLYMLVFAQLNESDHGEFLQVASVHLNGHEGCRACKYQIFDTKSFIMASEKKHGHKYGYGNVVYKNQRTWVDIDCPEHGRISILPKTHLDSPGCTKCTVPRFYSKGQIQWLEWIAVRNLANIQHAENGGEYRIPGTKFSADGYCRDTNTVYEYAGSFYHSDPRVFDQTLKHPLYNMTHGDNYKRTLKREKEITALGFNIITMWELDFINIQKKVTKIQRAWRLFQVARCVRRLQCVQ